MTGHVVVPGLVPSATLTPSTSLVPQGAVYSGGPITPHQIALACGPGGTYVDVTGYVEFGEGVTYSYGRPDQFSDVSPGTFGFTLNNADGRFTPGNASSPLAVKVTEGMGVSWLLGTRLTHFTILTVEIPADEATWYQLRVTCDDMLGTAGRHELTSIADGLTAIAVPEAQWKLDEDSSATTGADTFTSGLGAFQVTTSDPTATDLVTFGEPQNPALPGTAVAITAAPGQTTFFGTQHGNTFPTTHFPYPNPTDTTATYSYGWWNFWAYPGSTGTLAVTPFFAVGPGYSDSMQAIVTPGSISVRGGVSGTSTHVWTPAETLTPHYISLQPQVTWSGSYWQLAVFLYIDFVYAGGTYFVSAGPNGSHIPTGLLTAGTAMQPVEVNLSVTTPAGAATPLSGTFQRVSHTLGVSLEQNALLNTEDQRRAVLDTLSTELSSAAYNGRPSLWGALIGFPDVSNRSVLDVYNDIVRTEQGHLFCTTTGTLLRPVEQIQVRDRDRPTTVKAAFQATDGAGPLGAAELDGPPAFVRDITNVAESVDVAGPDATVTVTDPTVLTVTSRAVTAGLSETVLLENVADLRLWGQDRIMRGKNIGIRVASFTVDAVTTPTDRTGDLLSLRPGDRIQLTGLPTQILGFNTWDGWLLGGTETHTVDASKFTFTPAPTLPAAPVYDTDRFAAAGDMILGNPYTATATSIVVDSWSAGFMSTAVPYTIQVEAEQMTVTAVTGSTLTVTRGVNRTTAAAHPIHTPLEVVPAALYAF